MDSSCQLLNSMYDQYIKIRNDYENAKSEIQRQVLYVSYELCDSRTAKIRASVYVNSVNGVIADVQELYVRISEVRNLLDFYGINIGVLPELYISPLILPDIELSWNMPSMD